MRDRLYLTIAGACRLLAVVALVGFMWTFRLTRRLTWSVRRLARRASSRPKNHPIPFVVALNERAPPSSRQPKPLRRMKYWVMDGDTIRDNSTMTVYRLAHIDCPETGAARHNISEKRRIVVQYVDERHSSFAKTFLNKVDRGQ